MATDVEARLRQILTTRLGVPAEQVTPEARLAEDLGLDSLDAVELAIAAERQFQIGLSDEHLAGLRTVADVVALVERLGGDRGHPAP
jgi:acyl carrier protein